MTRYSDLWPGPTNTGYQNAPGYSGLTAGNINSVAHGDVVRDKLFDLTTSKWDFTKLGVSFIACQFASNIPDDAIMRILSGGSARFCYCSFTPRPSIVTPPTWVWPSRPVADIPNRNGHEFSTLLFDDAGDVAFDRCDFWGGSNPIAMYWRRLDRRVTLINSWLHDFRDPDYPGAPISPYDHSDGIGDLGGTGDPQSLVTIIGNTIAGVANTNAIGMQGCSTPTPATYYNRVVIRRNYLTGFGYVLDACHCNPACTNIEVTDNIFATDIPWIWGPVYSVDAQRSTTNDQVFATNNNLWRRNRLLVVPGTSPAPTAGLQWTANDNGKFILPSGSLSVTDWAA